MPSALKELQLSLKKIHATETMQTHQKTHNNTLITFRDYQDHFRQNDLCTYNTLKGNVEFAHCKSSHIFLTMTCAKLLLTTFFREKKKHLPNDFSRHCVTLQTSNRKLFPQLYYYMKNYCNLIGLEQWYFSLI